METELTQFFCPLGLKQWLKEHARARGLSMSVVVILLIEEARKAEQREQMERRLAAASLADSAL